MIEFITKIPDVVWAALLASLLTFSGVILSNRNSRLQTLAQLEHDSRQRDREREMDLRQDVYIRAAEAISRSLNMLARLPDLNISDRELSADFSDDSSALAKIQVVGTNETVQAVTAFQQQLASAYLELVLRRASLIERKNSIELLSEFVDKVQAEQDRNVNLMKQLNLEGSSDERIWKLVKDSFEFEKEQYTNYIQERQALWDQQNPEYIRFAESCFVKFLEVSKLVPPAIFAARAELELPLDREKYLATFNENNERMMAIFQSFLQDASTMMDA